MAGVTVVFGELDADKQFETNSGVDNAGDDSAGAGSGSEVEITGADTITLEFDSTGINGVNSDDHGVANKLSSNR
jgi:hypothetical protein